jgi:antitoxin YefM
MVVLARSDYESMKETLHLLGNPNNAKRLFDGIKEYEQGKVVTKSIEELESFE